jgi:hypothetical protein
MPSAARALRGARATRQRRSAPPGTLPCAIVAVTVARVCNSYLACLQRREGKAPPIQIGRARHGYCAERLARSEVRTSAPECGLPFRFVEIARGVSDGHIQDRPQARRHGAPQSGTTDPEPPSGQACASIQACGRRSSDGDAKTGQYRGRPASHALGSAARSGYALRRRRLRRRRTVSRFTSTRTSLSHLPPHQGCDNADDEVHEHPTEWPDEISVEPHVPHPSDPVEVTTEPRAAHPERLRARNRCPTMRPRLHRSTTARASR